MTPVFTSGAVLRQIVLDAIVREVPALTPDMHRVFASMFRDGPPPEAEQLTREFGIGHTTFYCRFFRAGLPSPKAYLRWSGLLRMAAVWSNGRCRNRPAAVAAGIRYEWGVPRWLGDNFGLRRVDVCTLGVGGLLEQFLHFAIRPHHAALSRLHPLMKVPASDPRRARALARRAA